MEVRAVDNLNNLFHVKNLVHPTLIDLLHKEGTQTYQKQNVNWQDGRLRDKVIPYKGSVLSMISADITSKLKHFQKLTKTNYSKFTIEYWQDHAGYTSNMHIDNPRMGALMQYYIGYVNLNLGTKFYYAEHKDGRDEDTAQHWILYNKNLPIRYKFPHETNSGYFSINNRIQAHDMPNPVGTTDYRISAVIHFDM